MAITVIRYSEHPELWADTGTVCDDPHGVLAEGHTVPCVWDGTTEGLGDGIDAMIAGAFEALEVGHRPTALGVLAAEIKSQFHGRRLADTVLDGMAELARSVGLAHLIAPVRPSLKDRYPIIPIERYVTWTRQDGEPFDPWIRVHLRRGAEIAKPIQYSLRITGTVAEWEQWTGMRFPDDGLHTFPAGLAPVEIDRRRDIGSYWEPNVWIIHTVHEPEAPG